MENQKRAYTLAEAAKELTISLSLAYRLVNSGQLKARKVGDRWIVPSFAIDEFLGSGNQPACPAGK